MLNGVKREWRTDDGSVWLMQGDSREIVQHLEANSIDCTVTSPPYNQLEGIDPTKLTGIWGIKGATGKAKGAFTDNGYFDGVTELEYQQQQNAIFSRCYELTRDRGSLFYNHQIRWRDGEILHPALWFHPEAWRLRSEIIWDRGGGMMFNAKMFCRFDERLLWFAKGQHKWNQSAVGYGTVWRIAREQNKEHPVAYPLELPLRCIEAATDPGDVVLDPYSGSATTGVASVRLGRQYIGIEQEEKWFDVGVSRITEELHRYRAFESIPRITQRSLLEDA